ncbi:MAG: hypothetical protein JWO03_2253, partial [Bacteroidetes bacterium]|nr:hypothetical protein [Bacteroidota bacterium]
MNLKIATKTLLLVIRNLYLHIMKTVLSLILLGMLHMSAFAQCTGSVGDPIVDNTFGAGAANPGPALSPGTTNMIYVSTTCPQDGQYTIANYTSGCFGGWITLTDHTGNTNGYYMLVNADPTPKTFFNDTIDNLCGGVDYLFSAWVINVVARTGYIEPNLTFSIRTPSGTLLQSNNTGNIPISGTTWGLHSFNFTTPAGVTSVVLSISNNATGGSGNDLAIDDISFRAVGPLTSVGIQGYTVDTVSFCGSIPALTLTSQVQPCYASTDYQWQRSANGGTTWADITGATNPTYLPGISTYGTYLYRLAVAAHGNIGSARCQVVSTVISITYAPGPALTVSPKDTSVCPGKKVIITASGPTGTYIWSDGHHGPIDTVTVNAASLYIVTVTSSSGCTSVDTAFTHIGTLATPSITTTGTAHCPTDSLTLTATGGTSYIWSTGALTPAIRVYPLPVRTYTVTASNASGCTASASVTPPGGTPWSFTIQVVNPPCPGRNMGTITVSVGGGGTYHYAWSNGDTQAQTDSLAPGPYTVTVSDGGNCDTVLSFNLVSGTFLSINTTDTTICPGKQVRLTASGGTGQYQWVNGPATATNTVTATTDSIFIVHMTGATGGCPSADTAHIHIQPSTQPIITQQAPQRCAGDPITLIVSGGSGYTWSTTATTSSISIVPVTGAIYYVTATAPNLCPAVDTFIAQAKLPMIITPGQSDPPCPGRDVGTIDLFSGGNSYHYIWSNNDTTAHLNGLAPGVYTV